MKCKYCTGEGWKLNQSVLERQKRCPYCGRTINITNEEWFASLTTEEKAEWLDGVEGQDNIEYWLKWLKEKYKDG